MMTDGITKSMEINVSTKQYVNNITSLLQTCKLLRQLNSLIKHEAWSKMPHTYPSIPPGGEIARSFYWGANLPATAARTQAAWSRNEYESTVPLRWLVRNRTIFPLTTAGLRLLMGTELLYSGHTKKNYTLCWTHFFVKLYEILLC